MRFNSLRDAGRLAQMRILVGGWCSNFLRDVVNMRSKINLIHGDCMEAMKDMPDNAFELSIVDPPYGIGVAKVGTFGGRGEFGKGKYNPTSKKSVEAKNYGAKEWDNKIPEDVYFKEVTL